MPGLERLLLSIQRRDAALGARRPDAVNALVAAVEAKLDAARQLQLARDRWAMRAPELSRYRVAIGAPIDLFTELKPPLEDIKSLAGSPPPTLTFIQRRVARILKLVSEIAPARGSRGRSRAARQRGAARGQCSGDSTRSRARGRHDPRLGRVVCRGRGADAGAQRRARTFNRCCGRHNSGDHTSQDAARPRSRSARFPARTIARLCRRSANPEPVIVVPTRGAAQQLQRALAAAAVKATLVTRDELYDHLHARLPNPPRRLTALERDVIAQAAARAAAAAGGELSFQLRPGLVAEMLRFYDQLRRQSQHVNRFEELIGEALGSDDVDRATARMRTQTRFLAEAFRDYERRVRDSGACDEHTLRERLMAEPATIPFGMSSSRLPTGLPTATDCTPPTSICWRGFPDSRRSTSCRPSACLRRASTSGCTTGGRGWRRRCRQRRRLESPARAAQRTARLLTAHPCTPAGAPPEEPWWTIAIAKKSWSMVARRLKADRRNGDAVPLDRTAVVFKQPLPYLYLAAEVFGAAGIPYQASDALPLAAEPTAAAVDLVLDAVASNFTREHARRAAAVAAFRVSPRRGRGDARARSAPSIAR